MGEGLGVVLYADKIYLACGLMLKKLLPLMIELAVILKQF